jgi:hypothetical protein
MSTTTVMGRTPLTQEGAAICRILDEAAPTPLDEEEILQRCGIFCTPVTVGETLAKLVQAGCIKDATRGTARPVPLYAPATVLTRIEGQRDGALALAAVAEQLGMPAAISACEQALESWARAEADPDMGLGAYGQGFRTAWANWLMINCG